MDMKPVDSTNIKRVGHDPATNKMRVQFHSGATWEYDDVPEHHHTGIMGADSPGSYFHANIKNRHKGRMVE